MLNNNLKKYQLILASGSPRRQQFLKDMGLDFKIVLKFVDEIYPDNLQAKEITDYLAKLKAGPFENSIEDNQIIITSDTIVWHKDTSLGKPRDSNEAIQMLQTLSNDWHKVITSICFTTSEAQKIVNCITEVKFKNLTNDEILFYVENYKPLDKAGAYGIQEWIGAIGIDQIKGSYNNVVGLPTHLFYETLNTITTS